METLKAHKFTLGLIVLAAAARLLPHPPNVTPIAAMALLGGAYLGRRAAYLFPLAALLLSDLFLGLHATLPYVYAGFLFTAFLGTRLHEGRTPGRIVAASLASSVVFFLVTNFGVWIGGGMYPRDAQGLSACYAAALPFFRNSLFGDLGFTAVLFGIEAFATRPQRSPALPA